VRREYILKGDMKVVRRHCGRCDYVWDVPEATRVAAVTASGPIRRIRHIGNKPESNRSLLNVQHIPAGHYLFALNLPTSRACGSLSWELRSRRQRSISFFVGGVAQRDGTTSRSAQ
jgi:hypothetical protein